MKTIRVSQLKEPERYEAMMDGTEVEGGYVMEYTEYHEYGELVCKFVLRNTDGRD